MPRTEHHAALDAVAADTTKPSSLRLKALLALSSGGEDLSDAAFKLLTDLFVDPANPGLRMDAAARLANTKLTPAQWDAYLALLPNAGPLEQSELLVALAVSQNYKRISKDTGRKIAVAFSKSSMLGTFRQDLVRKAFGFLPREIYEVLEPSFDAALAANDAKRERLGPLALMLGLWRLHRPDTAATEPVPPVSLGLPASRGACSSSTA